MEQSNPLGRPVIKRVNTITKSVINGQFSAHASNLRFSALLWIAGKICRIRFSLSSIIIASLTIAGLWQTGQGTYIYAKALLAQYLIASSWQESLYSDAKIKPWSWADTWPVARLMVPKYDIDLYVLAGDSGRTLAFGPGHRYGTPNPGEKGNSLISAHRDTHFRFLQHMKINDEIILQNQQGLVKHLVVYDIKIVTADNATLPVGNGEAMITLVTCYPFDGITTGGSLRYLVILVEKPQSPPMLT